MKAALLLIPALLFTGPASAPAQTPDVSGTWLANDVPYAPWTAKLKQDGGKLNGTMEQNGGLRGLVDIYQGTIDGNKISLKVNSPDGARAITFTGTVKGDEMVLNRSTEFLTQASLGGTGLFGSNAAPQFTLHRAVQSTANQEHWVAEKGVAFSPWTFDLAVRDGAVTGSVGQGREDPDSGIVTSMIGPFEIYDGKAGGNDIEFKVKTADGGRIITFHGTRKGFEIAFTRHCEVVSGDPGMTGILGANGATKFTALLGTGAAPGNPPTPHARVPAPVAAAPAGPAGIWQASSVPSGPWTFDLRMAGNSLGGTVQQGTSAAPVSIAGGKVSAAAISFKVLSPDGERIVTFSGRVSGNEISFVRQITPLAGGTRGGNDLFGGSAPLQFVANRKASAARTFNFKGASIDISGIQSLPDLDTILASYRRQIEIVDLAVPDPAIKSFLLSVPMVAIASPGSAPDNAAYSGRSRGVVLQSLSYGAEKPVVLHELMHAYHDQKVPNGFANAEILKLFDQARSGGQFPANSYMLSRPGEYFAMVASVYLHGSAARDPFTRQAIRLKQPDCYNWLEKEFGPR